MANIIIMNILQINYRNPNNFKFVIKEITKILSKNYRFYVKKKKYVLVFF